MKLPKLVACIASYYDDDPDTVILRSIVVTRMKDDAIIFSRYYELDDYSDDEACDEIDAIVGGYQKSTESIDVIHGDNAVPVEKYNGYYVIQMIKSSEYKEIVRKHRK